MAGSSDVLLGVGVAAVLGVAVFVVLSKKNAAGIQVPAKQAQSQAQPAAAAGSPAAQTTFTAQQAQPASAPAPAARAQLPPAAASSSGTSIGSVAASAGPIAISVGAAIAKDIGAKMADRLLARLAGKKNLATALAQKVAQKAASSAARCGIKTAEKMGTKLATKLGEMGAKEAAKAAMGPVGWAMAAFDVLSLGLDMADPGGYGKLNTLDQIYKQRDGLRDKAAAQGGFPFVVGPLTALSDADSQALFQQVTQDYILSKLTDYVASLDLTKLTQDQLDAQLSTQEDTISDYLATDAGFAELFSAACAAKSGKPIGSGDCSWPDAGSCNSSYKWPMADTSTDIFTFWTGDQCQASAAQTVRKLCDDNGLDYDFANEVCTLTNKYCLSKGADTTVNEAHNSATDCKIPWNQQIAEALFGTTITRGLKQIFSIEQYQPCDPNKEWGYEQLPTPLKTFLQVGSYLSPAMLVLKQTTGLMCFDKNIQSCPTGMEKSNALCYTPCKDGYKSDGATQCYKVYPGWEQNDATTIVNVGKVLHANPGKPLSTCPADKDKNAGLCYSKCAANEYGVGPVCWTSCPDGYKDSGASFCEKPSSYGRGAGYPWKGSDGISNNGMLSRCAKDNPQGCEMSGAIAYPRCKAGFHAVGCCVCSPDCPAGTTDTGAVCNKNSHGRGAGTPLQCGPGQTQDTAGLCYDACPTGTHKTTIGMCDSGCPDGAKDSGVSCLRQSYSRGAGVIPWSMHVKKRIAPYGKK